MQFMYHSVATDANGFPDGGSKPLSEFSLVELWSALQCRLDPERYAVLRFQDDLVLDTLGHAYEAYASMSDNVRTRAEELLDGMSAEMRAGQALLNTERLSLFQEFEGHCVRFKQEIENLGGLSGLVSSTFVSLTDEQWEDVVALRRERQAADSTASSQA